MSEAFDIDALLKRHPLPWLVECDESSRFGPEWGWNVHDRNSNAVAESMLESTARLLAAAPGMVKAIRDHLEWGPKTGSDRSLCDEALKASLP